MRTPLRNAWLVPLALTAQLAGVYVVPAGDDALIRRFCLAVTYALLLFVVWRNRRWWGVRVLAVGLLLNVLAMGVGRGLMPVAPETLHAAGLGHGIATTPVGQPAPRSKDVVMQKSQTPLWPLTDSIPVSRGNVHYAMSPGDAVILIGMAIGLVEAIIASESLRGGRGAGVTMQKAGVGG